MTKSRKDRIAFRPNLGEGPLEERIVPATIGTSVIRTNESLQRAFALNRLSASLSGQNLSNTILRQVRAATSDARNAINSQISQLFAGGRPTPQQRVDFRASVDGILSATALNLSNLAALLPEGSRELVPGIQRAFLGNQSGSLSNRINQALQSNRATRTPQLFESAISQAISRATTQRTNSFDNFLGNRASGLLAVDESGTTIPLSQFIGTQVVNQLGNTLGAFSQSFNNLAGSMLFPDGATTSTPAAQQAFGNQFNSALGLVAFQLRSSLSLIPGLASNLRPQLQTALFGTGANSTSLFSNLQNLPTTSDGFNAASTTAFTNAFQGLTTPLSSFFNLPASQSFILRPGEASGLFGSQFSGLGNGFNNGFGSGFPGFGVASTNFNSNFGTGFNTLVSGLNNGFGFSTPTSNGASGTGLFGGSSTGLRT